MEVPKMLKSLGLHTVTPFPPCAVGLSLDVWPRHGPGPIKSSSASHRSRWPLNCTWPTLGLLVRQTGEGALILGRVLPKVTAGKRFAPKGLASVPQHRLQSCAFHIFTVGHKWLFKFKFSKIY